MGDPERHPGITKPMISYDRYSRRVKRFFPEMSRWTIEEIHEMWKNTQVLKDRKLKKDFRRNLYRTLRYLVCHLEIRYETNEDAYLVIPMRKQDYSPKNRNPEWPEYLTYQTVNLAIDILIEQNYILYAAGNKMLNIFGKIKALSDKPETGKNLFHGKGFTTRIYRNKLYCEHSLRKQLLKKFEGRGKKALRKAKTWGIRKLLEENLIEVEEEIPVSAYIRDENGVFVPAGRREQQQADRLNYLVNKAGLSFQGRPLFMTRRFARDYSHHGRFYSPWMNVKKKFRKQVLKQYSCEVDYSNFALHFIMAHEGRHLWLNSKEREKGIYESFMESYSIPPAYRKVIKACMLVPLGAGSRKSALGGIRKVLYKTGHSISQETSLKSDPVARHLKYLRDNGFPSTTPHRFFDAKLLLEMIEDFFDKQNPNIVKSWFYSKGILRVMRQESDIIYNVIHELHRKTGAVGIPLHDAIYVQPEHQEIARQIMEQEFVKRISVIRAFDVMRYINDGKGKMWDFYRRCQNWNKSRQELGQAVGPGSLTYIIAIDTFKSKLKRNPILAKELLAGFIRTLSMGTPFCRILEPP